MPSTSDAHSDPTFRHYHASQAVSYAKARGSYSSELYSNVLSYHSSTSGAFDTLLDVGCGPGNATRDLASYFLHASGADPGAEMINEARRNGDDKVTASGEPITFFVGAAEQIAEKVKDSSVDLLVAAMAAHWFDMKGFWDAAARAVKPGGTVALWTHASLYCHPATTNASDVQKVLFHLEEDLLGPHELPPNRISRTIYDSLLLPWNITPPIEPFPASSYIRYEWDRDGILTNGEDFFGGSKEVTLGELEKSLSTASMVTRWRQAHPDLVGTEMDCVRSTMIDIGLAMGVDKSSIPATKIRTGHATVLLLFKRA
ncbi:putative methyltransferase [Lachnellula cervina]|uniref:Putative methyltransferase n=1 Tax=Lachnellula cervina TaxID=1316786 RepID=A0A7D8UXH9_9HELO|nr:putative methyltransferase [Lachnellula cervina]